MYYQEILSILNWIDSREENTVSFAVILIVVLFLGYMAVYFGMKEGFILKIQRDLFVIIVAFFILNIALLKNDVCNLKSNEKIPNLSLIYSLNNLKILFQYIVQLN